MRVFDTNLDWQKSDTYDYADNLVHTDWAWEGLRRNRHFQQRWHETQDCFQVLEDHDRLRIIAVPEDGQVLARWGCLYTDAPYRNASAATVIWQPERYSRVLPMEAFARDNRPQASADLFRLREMCCHLTLLLQKDGPQHLFVRDGGPGFQLVVTGASLLEPVHLLADAVLNPKDARMRLAAMQCFNDLRTTGHLVQSHRPVAPTTKRLRMVLQALDGALAGARQRDIAIALYGEARVERDWHYKHNYLRDHVRRAIKRGRDLMNGGYLRFLR